MRSEIADLDGALADYGADIVLRRVSGTAPNQTNLNVTVRAAVRSYQPSELVGGIGQTDSLVIISPTQIAAAGWPAGESASATVADPTLPRRLDKMIIAGRTRNVEVVDPIYLGGELVRIEVRVLG